MSDVFSLYTAKNQNQKTLELLSKVFPDNEELQDSIGTLLENKELWKKRLTKTWLGRKRPTYTQWMIRDINFLFKQTVEAEKLYREAANTWEYNQVKEQSKRETAAGVGGVLSVINIWRTLSNTKIHLIGK